MSREIQKLFFEGILDPDILDKLGNIDIGKLNLPLSDHTFIDEDDELIRDGNNGSISEGFNGQRNAGRRRAPLDHDEGARVRRVSSEGSSDRGSMAARSAKERSSSVNEEDEDRGPASDEDEFGVLDEEEEEEK